MCLIHYMLLYHKTVILSIVNGPSNISQLLGFLVGKTISRFLSVTVVDTRRANGNSSNAGIEQLTENYVSHANKIELFAGYRVFTTPYKDQLACKTSM